MTEVASGRTAALASTAARNAGGENAASPSGPAPFRRRHNGPGPAEVAAMLGELGLASLDELVDRAVPRAIRLGRPLAFGDASIDRGLTEREALDRLRAMASENQVRRSFAGMGYHACTTPPVIQRNVLENPGWYTAYTPYQAEIAQGRLEALLNFQTLVLDLTGLEVANASLLDEATAAAEAMSLCYYALREKRRRFLVAADCHPQTIEVVSTRAWPLDIEIEVAEPHELETRLAASGSEIFAVLLQTPGTDGAVRDPAPVFARARELGALAVAAVDPLATVLLRSPGELGADVAVGSLQRFGMPMGFGGPHAAFIAVREAHKRLLPGRVVGVSKDAGGRPALRLAMQTREQHIRREKATSNICTAQVLPAVVASMYAVYHGPEGLRGIASQVHGLAASLATGLGALGLGLRHASFFDTVRVELGSLERERAVLEHARRGGLELRPFGDGSVGVALDETTTPGDVEALLAVFAAAAGDSGQPTANRRATDPGAEHLPQALQRRGTILDHEVFQRYRSETELLRYLHRLESKDLSLTTSMIPLGSCTMKLNATAEMMPVTWPGFAELHPFAPPEATAGMLRLCRELEEWLAEITGLPAVSLQPNAGSQGEYSGLLVIRRFHERRGEGHRRVCLIPTSAHGTNPASAVMAGLRVVSVACDDNGNIDLSDLRSKAEKHSRDLAALMVTYPSTHGVFEEEIRSICDVVHEHGGQVYLDGANMNAQVGLCRPGDYGADVCHLNLHKTFCIPHGGGGPGMGPIAAAPHLAPYLPGHRTAGIGDEQSLGAVSATPYGSGAILPISWAYIAMMGSEGLAEASKIAVLNANYMARRLQDHYPVLYRGRGRLVAHECILDLRPLERSGIKVEDVAKRLMDYGFHAPTVSWPVTGTLMLEPTESESKEELDRYCDALIAIRDEAREIEQGRVAVEDSPLRRAPHTAFELAHEDWNRPYSREQAAFPSAWTREHKYWPPVARIDAAWGDRNLFCSCAGLEAVAELAGSE
ncbi:MAG TPA: aminomethyl-transferring glycine dehydrogenase [Thermoanaerobaculia bacterium]|nr:aminomethyl-transferring glycine dehydrogenase [Thermoanaerobaculia bacterium]